MVVPALGTDAEMGRFPKVEVKRQATSMPWMLVPANTLQGKTIIPNTLLRGVGDWIALSAGTSFPPELEFTEEGWTYTTSPFSHVSAWYTKNNDGTLQALGNDPVAIAQTFNSGLDPSALMDDLFFGFRPDGRSPYTGVFPCGSKDAMAYSPKGVTSVPVQSNKNNLDSLGCCVAEAMNMGACIELTGGVDSRLLLALGLWAGGKATKSFTIGSDTDADVRIAREISDSLGMEHRVIQVDLDEMQLAVDTIRFVQDSGFVCNAAAYGWLPTIFRTLDSWRDAQLSGVGGEIGEGFYYTGLDRLFEVLNSPKLWLRTRSLVDGGRWASLFEGGFRGRLTQVARERTELSESKSWRLRTDDFYSHARIHGWAIPVIRASAAWYRPITPFLSHEYFKWSQSLSIKQRQNRTAQCELIDRICPDLGKFTYAKSLSVLNGSRFSRRCAKAKRMAMRVLPCPTAQPDRWVMTARLLIRSLDCIDCVVDRLRTLEGVRVDRVATVLRSDPFESAHAIGALLTMAQAIEEHAALRPNGLWQD